MQEIAEEAGVNKALLHYYFRNKSRLGEAVFRRVAAVCSRGSPASSAVARTSRRKSARVVEVYFTQLSKVPYVPGYVLSELNQHPERSHQLLEIVRTLRFESGRAGLHRCAVDAVGARRPRRTDPPDRGGSVPREPRVALRLPVCRATDALRRAPARRPRIRAFHEAARRNARAVLPRRAATMRTLLAGCLRRRVARRDAQLSLRFRPRATRCASARCKLRRLRPTRATRQLQLQAAATELRLRNIGVERLPTFNGFGQLQYQSAVTSIEVPIPGVQIPDASALHIRRARRHPSECARFLAAAAHGTRARAAPRSTGADPRRVVSAAAGSERRLLLGAPASGAAGPGRRGDRRS